MDDVRQAERERRRIDGPLCPRVVRIYLNYPDLTSPNSGDLPLSTAWIVPYFQNKARETAIVICCISRIAPFTWLVSARP